jgi:hypothetical protein
MKLYVHLMYTLLFICMVSLYVKIAKVQQDIEHLVVLEEMGICE